MRREGHRVAAPAVGLAAILALALLLLLSTGCSQRANTGELVLTGTVVIDDIQLQVPVLAVPPLNLTVGLPSVTSTAQVATVQTAASAGVAGTGVGLAAAVSGGGAGSGSSTNPTASRSRVASVPVQPGETVEAGAVVAVMDQSLLQAGLHSAQLAAATASARVDEIDARIDKVSASASDLASQTTAISTTISDLSAQKLTLQAQLSAAQIELARLNALPPSTSPTSTPGGMTPQQIAGEKALATATIAQLTTAIAQLDKGIATAQAGLTKLQSGQSKITDAQRIMNDLRELAVVASDATSASVDVAQAHLDATVVTAPNAGKVIEVANAGDVLAAGAPLVTIRPLGTPQVETWIDSSEAGPVAVGQEATVMIDSHPYDLYVAHVTFVSPETGFPPTSYATDVIHMIRAVKVRVTLDGPYELPAGTPADVTITTR